MMKENWIFVAFFALLIVIGLILGRMFFLEQTVDEDVAEMLPFDQMELFEPPPLRLFSDAMVVSQEEPMELEATPTLPPIELSALFEEPAAELGTSEPIIPPSLAVAEETVALVDTVAVVDEVAVADEVVVVDAVVVFERPTPVPELNASVEKTSEVPAPTASVAPGSYVYFFTGVPVQPTPRPIVPRPVAPRAIAPMNYYTYTSGYTFSSVSVVSAPVVQPYYVAPVFVPHWGYSNRVFVKPLVYFP